MGAENIQMPTSQNEEHWDKKMLNFSCCNFSILLAHTVIAKEKTFLQQHEQIVLSKKRHKNMVGRKVKTLLLLVGSAAG